MQADQIVVEGQAEFRIVFTDIGAAVIVDQHDGPKAFALAFEMEFLQYVSGVRSFQDQVCQIVPPGGF